jgi:hypothetical protein
MKYIKTFSGLAQFHSMGFALGFLESTHELVQMAGFNYNSDGYTS